MQVISNALNDLTIEDSQAFQNLTVFPLLGAQSHARDYVTLRDAIAARTALLREVDDSGSVPDIVLENRGQRPVLVLEGEELVGAKQNRTANLTTLAPAGKTTPVAVTCVEAGRWAYTSRVFSASDQMHFSAGRKKKLLSVHRAMETFGRPTADQNEVWNDISAKSRRMNVNSPTAAMADMYANRQADIDDYVGAFSAERLQLGAVFAIGASLEGLELFDSHDTLHDMLPKLIRSYALDAIEVSDDDKTRPASDDARGFVARVAACDARPHDSAGLGTNLRLKGPGVIAGALVAEKRLVHLAGFSAPEEPMREQQEARGLSRLWRRRRNVH